MKKSKRQRLHELMWDEIYVADIPLYRYEFDPYFERVVERTYYVLDKTKCGFWIAGNGRVRFIAEHNLLHGRKARCRLTKRRALEDYIKRTVRRVEILEWNMKESRMGLRLAKALSLTNLNTNNGRI